MTREEFELKYCIPLSFDNPIRFDSLLIHPVILKDYYKFMMFSEILTIKKDRIPDAKIISMSYMEYICNLLIQENEAPLEEKVKTVQILGLIELVLKQEITSFGIKKDKLDRLVLYVNDYVFTHKKFDEFKDIILFQNLPNYNKLDLNPILEEEIKKADEIRNGKAKSVSLEKRIVSCCVNTGMSLEDVKNMTIRKFVMLEDMKDKETMYHIKSLVSMTGLVKFNEPIQHYLMDSNRDPLEGKLMGYDSLKNKVNH